MCGEFVQLHSQRPLVVCEFSVEPPRKAYVHRRTKPAEMAPAPKCYRTPNREPANRVRSRCQPHVNTHATRKMIQQRSTFKTNYFVHVKHHPLQSAPKYAQAPRGPPVKAGHTRGHSQAHGTGSCPTSFGTLSCFLPRPPLRTILRINSTRFSGESAYLSNKKEVPDDEHRARPPLDAEAVHGGNTAAAEAGWKWFPKTSRCSNRHLNPREPIKFEGRFAATAARRSRNRFGRRSRCKFDQGWGKRHRQQGFVYLLQRTAVSRGREASKERALSKGKPKQTG